MKYDLFWPLIACPIQYPTRSGSTLPQHHRLGGSKSAWLETTPPLTTDILYQRFPCEVSRNEVLTKWTPEAAAAYARAVINKRGWTKLLSLVKE